MAPPHADTESGHAPAWKLIAKTCLTLWLVELGIMLALPQLKSLSPPWKIALVDGALVTLFACPLAYLWMFGTRALRSQFHSTGAVTAFLRFGAVVLVVEVVIMTVLEGSDLALPGWGIALLDATLLASVCAAFIPLAVEAPGATSSWRAALPRLAEKGLEFAPSLAVKITGVATLSTLLAVGATVWMSFDAASELLMEGALESMDSAAFRQVERLADATDRVRSDTAHMVRDEAVEGFLNAHLDGSDAEEKGTPAEAWEARLGHAFTGLIESKGYWQVRLIDLRGGGMEVARAEWDAETGAVRVVPASELQDKSDAAYVRSGRALLHGQVHASAISLNREHGQISLPRTPTQRFVAPIYLAPRSGEASSNLAALVSQIRNLDELLTLAAFASAQSGDSSWKEHYKKHSARLDASLAAVIATGDARQTQAAVRITEDNSALVGMEEDAFLLVAQGRSAEAVELLEGRRYEVLKASYAADVSDLVAALEADAAHAGPDALIVLNTFAGPILHECLDAGSAFRVVLANEEGGFIHHAESDLEWSFEEGSTNQFRSRHPTIWELVQSSPDGRLNGALGDSFFAANRLALNPGLDDSYVWTLMLASRGEILSGVHELKDNLILLGTGAILVAGLLCAFTLRRLTRPIKELTAGAGLIARGVEDVQLPTAGRDEVGRLGRALADLIAKLQEHSRVADKKSAQVKELNETLEAQVMQRTARLIASEARLSSIMNSAGDAFITLNQDGLVQFWNEAAAETFGVPAAEMIGEPVTRFIPEEFREAHNAGFANFMSSGEPASASKQLSLEAQRGDGTRFPAKITLTAAPTDEGALVVAVLRDLTEERALQMQLDQARKLESIGNLAAGVAHEINTPTQYVTDNVQFLEESCGNLVELAQGLLGCIEAGKDSDDPVLAALEQQVEDADLEFLVEEVPRAFEHSVQGLASITKIVRAMKEFSHPGSQDKALANLAHIIDNTITVGRNEWKYCADLELVLDPVLPTVPCVTGDIGQVVLNLVVNAAHAIEERRETEGTTDKGMITIRTALHEPWVELRIEDTGCGMTPETAERIFDPFFTTKEVGKGTGQGLAIAHTIIVEGHGGTLTVESEPGAGTAFVIRLPLDMSDVFDED